MYMYVNIVNRSTVSALLYSPRRRTKLCKMVIDGIVLIMFNSSVLKYFNISL